MLYQIPASLFSKMQATDWYTRKKWLEDPRGLTFTVDLFRINGNQRRALMYNKQGEIWGEVIEDSGAILTSSDGFTFSPNDIVAVMGAHKKRCGLFWLSTKFEYYDLLSI